MAQSLSQIYFHLVFSTKNRLLLAERVGSLFRQPRAYRCPETQYIGEQEEHHRRESYQEEFRRLFRKYGITYDERYVWD